jgi:chitinase
LQGTKGTELLCSEFSISITKYATQGPRSVPLVRRSRSVQASLAETGCTCPATETSPDLISSTASSFSAITTSPITATGPSVSTSQVSPLSTPVESGTQNVVYWGQKGVGTVENNDLATYCNSNSGIDIIVLAFLHQYGNGQTVPSGSIGQSCSISTSGEAQQCDALGAAIQQCQSDGISVILSLGGAVGAYSLTSRQEAETIGQNLWEAYGNTDRSDIPRPFGSTFVNGWDFNLERNNSNQYYQYLISKLRSNFASDFSNTYYITGAPQCPIPEPNM